MTASFRDPAPEELFLDANGLRLHALAWGPPEAEAKGPTVLLAHGFLDLAWSWAPYAARLAARGQRCVAWDWRGHGESDHVGAGGYYHFPDYVRDLHELRPQLAQGDVHLVAHSMGGAVACMYAGLRPEGLRSLTVIEGLGPPEWKVERAPEKVLQWFEGLDRARARTPRVIASYAEAVKRMRVQNAALSEELGLFLAEKALRPVPGGYAWRFDPLHRTTSPTPFRKAALEAFCQRVDVPVLLVAGARGFRLADEAERADWFPAARLVELPDVGHMIHQVAPEALDGITRAHFADAIA
ncbi:MAG: alpha/beta hydrolase [Myxococcota bacterium]